MGTVRELHDRAMALVEVAVFAPHLGDVDAAEKVRLNREGYHLESEAAVRCVLADRPEPTTTILCRSAAWMAYNAEMYAAAYAIAALGVQTAPASLLPELYEVMAAARAALIPTGPAGGGS